MKQNTTKTPHAVRVIPCMGAALATAGTLTLAGCGVWQATKDTTVGVAEWLFTTQVRTMNVELTGRAALNETGAGQSLSTVVRFYQLKDSKTFEKLEYAQLQNNDLDLLKTDLVATKDVVLRPGASASISEPMDKDAEYVGVAAFFRTPAGNGAWKLAIPKKQWKATDPVKIEVQGNQLAMERANPNPKPLKHDAPQQSTPISGAAVASRAAAQNVGTAADALSGAKASAGALSKAAGGLLSN